MTSNSIVFQYKGIVLAEELQRQRILLMEGKITKSSKVFKDHPVFATDKSTNKFVARRRAKLKTRRERIAERLVRMGKKWEAEHLIYEEQERKREAEMKTREMELLTSDQGFLKQYEYGETNATTMKDQSYKENEAELNNFLKNECALMLTRLKPKDKQFKPFTKDLREVDAKRRMSEASISSLKSLKSVVARITSGLSKTEIHPSSKDDDDSTPKDISTPNDDLLEESTDSTSSNPNNIYVNPMIAKLKQTNNVHDMYMLAEQIVGDNIDNYDADADNAKDDESEAI